jgi:hypothetical protein
MEVAANSEKEDDMKGALVVHSHIEITETLVRLYVFLAQTLDRCLNEVARRTYPEQALQLHLAATRAEMMEILSVNRVVKEKVEQECHRMLALSAACLTNESPKPAMMGEVNVERAVLKNKTMALSDLLPCSEPPDQWNSGHHWPLCFEMIFGIVLYGGWMGNAEREE